jgi:uncharacterized protein YdiU (UPF0061 family)
MRVGFVHGVMNTDNMSILGLTIDYGPYGWIDNFDRDWTPNTTDEATRRYRFGYQPRVAHWNLLQLANALYPLFDATEPLQAGLDRYVAVFEAENRRMLADKLGLATFTDEDQQRVEALHMLMTGMEIDMTIFFRELARLDVQAPSLAPLEDAFYSPDKRELRAGELQAWLEDYAARVRSEGRPATERRAQMDAANPRYVLRNWLAQQAIDAAEQADYSLVSETLDVMRRPYTEQPGREHFAGRRPEWARNRPGCSMLSCSS